MKKKILFIFFLLAEVFIFAENKMNLQFSLAASSSFSPQPFLGANISVDFNWQNGIGIGGGIKEFLNISHRNEEVLLFGGPYIFIKYKYFFTGTGILFIEFISTASFYFNAGFAIPIKEIKNIKLGLDFGFEMWSPPLKTIVDTSDNYGYKQKILEQYDIKDLFKLYTGVSFLLPL